MDGTYRIPVASTNETSATELQQSIFNAPPLTTATLPPIPSVPVNAPNTGTNGTNVDGSGPQGVKRRRDDESDDEGAPMEEDDSDAPMEASSDED